MLVGGGGVKKSKKKSAIFLKDLLLRTISSPSLPAMNDSIFIDAWTMTMSMTTRLAVVFPPAHIWFFFVALLLFTSMTALWLTGTLTDYLPNSLTINNLALSRNFQIKKKTNLRCVEILLQYKIWLFRKLFLFFSRLDFTLKIRSKVLVFVFIVFFWK